MEDYKVTLDDFKRYLSLVDFMLNSARRLEQSSNILLDFLRTCYQLENN